ncbi:MAG: hypothetical protein OXH31_06185 [Gammaproteobacteria bacterium]|nr:hypothetical protein [Gammaproteobacteria bacterium]
MNSSPSNKSFTIYDSDGESVHEGTTPTTVVLRATKGLLSGETYTFKLFKDGEEVGSTTVKATVDGWVWGNLWPIGLIPLSDGYFFDPTIASQAVYVIAYLVVDVLTGDMWALPKSVMIESNDQSSSSDELKLKVKDPSEVSENEMENLVLLPTE